jgi:hypothetical protein
MIAFRSPNQIPDKRYACRVLVSTGMSTGRIFYIMLHPEDGCSKVLRNVDGFITQEIESSSS